MSVLALLVAVIVPLAFRQYGVTKTVTQTVLDCYFDGNAAHEHDASCYDANGNLVCTLAERPLHTHTEDCYDADGNLICGLEELTEEHVHGDACFTEITVDVPDQDAALPTKAFSDDVTNEYDEQLMKVDVVSPEGALPEDAEMKVSLVENDQVKDLVTAAVSNKTDGKLVDLRAVDITFVNAEGREVEPLDKVTVTLAADLIDTNEDFYLIHIDDLGNAIIVEPLSDEELAARDIDAADDELVFEADSFSTYVVVLTTMDKTLEAGDNETYRITVNAPAEAGIPQDAVLSVTEIVSGDEAYDAYLAQAKATLDEDTDADTLARFFDIKIMNGDEEIQPQAAVRVDIQLADAENFKDGAVSKALHFVDDSEVAEVLESAQNGAVTTFDTTSLSAYGVVYTGELDEVVEEEVVEETPEVVIPTYEFTIEDADTLSLSEMLQALDIVSADEADAFVASIVTITSTNEELLDAIKLNDDATAGQVKKAFGITTRYSAEFDSEGLEQLNAKELQAGDWAIIAVNAFDTETLTISTLSGQQIKIAVTDALSYTNVLSAEGASYRIVVKYGDDAQIPAGAELSVRELEKDTIEYMACLSEAAAQLLTNNDNVSFARFFDIEITLDGEKIEPQAPVQVSIEYPNAIHLSQGETLSVVHFAEEGTEVISDIEVSDNRKEISYEQASFSVTGTIIDTTAGGSIGTDNDYFLLIEYPTGSQNYYIVNNDGTLTPVDSQGNQVSVEYGMVWSFGGSWGENRRIYFDTEGTGFTWQEVSSDYYRRFLDPGAAYGITEEYNDGTHGENNPDPHENPSNTNPYINGYYVNLQDRPNRDAGQPAHGINPNTHEPYWDCTIDGRRVNSNLGIPERDDVGAWNSMALGLEGNTGRLYKNVNGTTHYIGVELDSGGIPIRIVGRQDAANAAKFVFAEADISTAVDYRDHTVNHIDISIDGSSQVDFPLAYGTYYMDNGDGTYTPLVVVAPGETYDPADYPAGAVFMENCTLHLSLAHVPITAEDMKHSKIKAYNPAGEELDDVFIVTGYSSNSVASNDTAQVRIEGSFKVADLDYRAYGGNGNEGFWDNNAGVWRNVPQDRLDHKITYSLTATKNIPFDLKDENQGITQLYQKVGDQYVKMTVPLDVALSSTFTYFDDAAGYPNAGKNGQNTCPGIHEYGGNFTNQWRQGQIKTTNQTGMDFRLTGDAENSTAVVAVEIVKNITDTTNKHIRLKETITQSFGVYVSSSKKNGGSVDRPENVSAPATGSNVPFYSGPDYPNYGRYTLFHNKDVEVQTTGKGNVYDYDVMQVMESKLDANGTPYYKGMFYITENKGDIRNTIIDQNNQLWMYVDTVMETEYAWRNDEYGGGASHVSKVYTDRTGDQVYQSIPEAAGRYSGLLNPGTSTTSTVSDYTSETWNEGGSRGTYDNGFLEFRVWNRYKQIGDLQLEKIVTGQGDTSKEFEFTIELTAPDGFFLDDTYPATLNGNDTTATVTPVTMDQIDSTKIVSGTVTVNLKHDDVFIINALPAGTEYTITETDYSSDGYTTTTNGKETGTIIARTVDADMNFVIPDDNKVEFTNDLETGDLELSKLVTGTTDTTQAFEFTIALEAPTGKTLASSYAATHSGDSSITSAAVTLSDNDTKGTVTVSLKANETFTLKGLPVGTTYTITENTPPAGYTSSVTSGSATGTIQAGTANKATVQFTNDYSKVNINVIKIDEKNNQKKLEGAEFELYKLTGEGQSQAYTVFADADGLSKRTTDANGELTFVGLLNGKYKIVETKSPDGYIATSPLEFYFTVSAGSTVTWTDASGNTITQQPSVTYALVSNVPTFTVSNTPGQPLPFTGGPGTTLYTLCGVAVMAAAGYYGLASRRRARKEVV